MEPERLDPEKIQACAKELFELIKQYPDQKRASPECKEKIHELEEKYGMPIMAAVLVRIQMGKLSIEDFGKMVEAETVAEDLSYIR